MEDGSVEIRVRRADAGVDVAFTVDRFVDGRAMGGCRILRGEECRGIDALALARDLARAMTDKARAAEIPVGGSKFVVLAHRGDDACVRDALAIVADILRMWRGRVYTGQDYGFGDRESDALHEMAPWGIVGVPGRGLDPAEWTARGVVAALRAIRTGLPLPGGIPVAFVQGAGKVGGRVIRGLVREGWRVTFAEPDSERHAGARAAGGIPAEAGSPCGVFVPCAGSHVLDADTVLRSGARAVAGSANVPWKSGEDRERVRSAGIFCPPDYVVNAGGLIAVAAEVFGYDIAEVERRVRRIASRVAALLRGELPADNRPSPSRTPSVQENADAERER